MSRTELTKVISIRIPAMYFRRLGYLAYNTGNPSETAREILKLYLDLGCILRVGPVEEPENIEAMASCVNPQCREPEVPWSPTLVEDLSSDPNKTRFAGFSKYD